MEYYDIVEGGGDSIYIDEKRSSELLGWMLRFGEKVVITGVVLSSVSLLVPSLVVMSAVGCAVSVPFGVVFASYACADALMSKLLLPPQLEEDAAEMRVDAGLQRSLLGEQVGGDLEEEKTNAETPVLRVNKVEERKQPTISEVDDCDLMGMKTHCESTTIAPQFGREDIEELVDEIGKFPSGKEFDRMEEEDEKVVGTRTELVDEIDMFPTGKEVVPVDHLEEEGEKVVGTRTESVPTGKEDDHKEQQENVVETQTESVDEIDTFPTGKEVDHMEEEEDEKVVETQTELVDEIDKFPTEKEDHHKEEEDEKSVDTRTESVDEFDKFPTGKEDDHREEDKKVVEIQTFATEEVPTLVFPLHKDTDEKMDSSSGKSSTTFEEVIIEGRRSGKRKFKTSSSALKLISRKRKGLSPVSARELEEGISILKETDQITTLAADKTLDPAGEEAVVHKSGSLSSDHVYKEEKAGEQSITLESNDDDDDDDDTKQIILLVKNHDDAYPVEMNNDNNNTTGVQVVVASGHKKIVLSDLLDENDGAGAGNDSNQQQTVITTVYNDHPQREENYKESKAIVAVDCELKNEEDIPLKEENDDTLISGDIGGGHSDEVGLREGGEEYVWKTMEAIRGIVGYKAPVSASRYEELEALYLFTGIEPPTSSSAHEFHNNLCFLMSVIGLK